MRERAADLRWVAIAAAIVVGVAFWAAGVQIGIVLAAAGVLGFVVAAWLDVAPRGGHVHDDGLLGRGVPELPRWLKR